MGPDLNRKDAIMRRVFAVLLVLPVLALTAPSARGDDYVVDDVHSSMSFRISHLGISWVHGRFNKFAGTFTVDKASPEKSRFEMTIPVDSIDTNQKMRDAHLLSPEFFDAQKFPQITFKSTSVKPVKDGLEVTGDFTMRGVTRPLTFTLKGGKEAPFMGKQRIGYSTELVLKRSDFGVGGENFKPPVLGDEVYIAIGFEGVKK